MTVVGAVHNINEERNDINNTIHLLPETRAVTISTRNVVRPFLTQHKKRSFCVKNDILTFLASVY